MGSARVCVADAKQRKAAVTTAAGCIGLITRPPIDLVLLERSLLQFAQRRNRHEIMGVLRDARTARARNRWPSLERPRGAGYAHANKSGEANMKQIRIGDITIDAVIEREGPWRRPQDFFPAYDEAVFKGPLPSMEPEVFDVALGMMVITY